MCMCVGAENRIVTCEKYIFWCEKGYKRILALGSPKKCYFLCRFGGLDTKKIALKELKYLCLVCFQTIPVSCDYGMIG